MSEGWVLAEEKAEKKLAKKRKLKKAKAKGDFGAKPAVAFGMSQQFPAKSMEVSKGASAPPKPASKFPFGTCFECGDASHWRQECPKVVGSVHPLANCEHVGGCWEGVEMWNVSTLVILR